MHCKWSYLQGFDSGIAFQARRECIKPDIVMLTWRKLLAHVCEEKIICKSDVDVLPPVPQGSKYTFQNTDLSYSLFLRSSPVRTCLCNSGKSRSEASGQMRL